MLQTGAIPFTGGEMLAFLDGQSRGDLPGVDRIVPSLVVFSGEALSP
jgi:hypothetical protein